MHKAQHFLDSVSSCTSGNYLYQLLSLMGFVMMLLVSSSAFANPFATPDDFSAASCPIDHKKYSIRNNASTATTPSLSSWKAGETSRTFTFEENSGNKIFTINFPILIDANNSNGTVPFYGSINDATSNAINLLHNSTRVQTDHTLDVSINRPVSKIGYKIQDLDSTTVQVNVGPWWNPRYETRTPYIEQVDVSTNNGRLTFNDIFHKINPGRNTVTAKDGENCSTGQCTIDATWSYKTADSVVNLKHNNDKRETGGSHAVGYSDFYFCLAPPKLVVKKQLSGNRVNNSANNTDQFEISVNRGTTTLGSYTTTGSNATVTNHSSEAISLAENISYTITEKVRNGANGTTLGEIANYTASYTCTNATTGSTTVMPTAAMSYNEANKTRSFTLANATYGDEITCIITNTPVNNYSFTGFVFNDNGGIAKNNSTNLDTNTKSDISSTFTGNPKYFNGIFDSQNEVGIGTTPSLSVSLTDCKGNNISTIAPNTNPQTELNNPLGEFKFAVPASAIANLTVKEVCLIQTEPNLWIFSVDTTPNIRRIDLTANPNRLDYKSDSTLNLDFGEVETDYASLVLIKSQYVNNCDVNANYTNTSFSTAEIRDIEPGKCIAYKIDAYNRGHVALNKIKISDELQNKSVKSVFTTPFPRGSSNAVYDNTNNLPIGTITSKEFSLAVPSEATPTRATLYFNTKYGN